MWNVLISEKKIKGAEEAFGGDKYVYCLDCADGFTSVCKFPNIPSCGTWICAVFIYQLYLSKLFLQQRLAE